MTPAPTQTLDQIPVHDPFVVADARTGRYHLFTAFDGRRGPIPGTGVVSYTSENLRDWSGPNVVFRVPDDSWADQDAAPWAPEVHEHDGRYYLFTTLHQPATELPWPQRGSTVFEVRAADDAGGRRPTARGTVIAVADALDGPFELVRTDRPVAPPEFMTLDGTLFVDDDGTPWMVYAHEWVQVIDGTFEAIRLSPDLSGAVGDPVHLFRASEGSWLREWTATAGSLAPYVSDGCQLRRLASGALTMLWASYRRHPDGHDEYVETSATSPSGSLFGPWVQNDILVDGNAGHGMVFDGFDGRSYLILHRGMNTPVVRAEIFEVVDDGDQLRVVVDRRDLSHPAEA